MFFNTLQRPPSLTRSCGAAPPGAATTRARTWRTVKRHAASSGSGNHAFNAEAQPNGNGGSPETSSGPVVDTSRAAAAARSTPESSKKRVVIVGGGWGGFGAALALAKAGAEVTLLDASENPGGLSSAFVTAGDCGSMASDCFDLTPAMDM